MGSWSRLFARPSGFGSDSKPRAEGSALTPSLSPRGRSDDRSLPSSSSLANQSSVKTPAAESAITSVNAGTAANLRLGSCRPSRVFRVLKEKEQARHQIHFVSLVGFCRVFRCSHYSEKQTN